MTYAEAIAYLDTFLNYEKTPLNANLPRDFNLRRMERLLDTMGNPHQRDGVVHVAGTKGKGSTCAFLNAVLRSAGYRVGLFTSPHLVSPRERLQVNGKCISEADFAAWVARFRPLFDAHRVTEHGRLTFFEVYTALAFAHFAERDAEALVLEVGMGGRLDATNVVLPAVSVITPIGLDHAAALGNTLDGIAREKAGIIKPGRPAVIAPQEPSAWRAIREIAAEKQAPFIEVGRDISAERIGIRDGRERCHLAGSAGRLADVSLRLLGAHQVSNAATALGALLELRKQGWRISDEAVRKGLESATLAGRFQTGIGPRGLTLVLDCAHTAESARALAQTLTECFPGRLVTFVVAMSADKDFGRFASALAPLAEQAFVTRTQDSPRAADVRKLAEAWQAHCPRVYATDSVTEAVAQAAVSATADRVLCITGSVYFVGEALQTVATEHYHAFQQEVDLC